MNRFFIATKVGKISNDNDIIIIMIIEEKPNNQMLVRPFSIDQFMQISTEISTQEHDKLSSTH